MKNIYQKLKNKCRITLFAARADPGHKHHGLDGTAFSKKKLPEQQQERSGEADTDVENAAASADDTADVGVTGKRAAASSVAVENATKKQRANEDKSMHDAKKEAARKETKKKAERAAKKEYDAGRYANLTDNQKEEASEATAKWYVNPTKKKKAERVK